VPHIDLTQQQLLQESLQRRAAPLDERERRAEAIVGAAFVAAAALLWLCYGVPSTWHPLPALAGLIAYAIAMRVRFHAGGIFTTPGQLAFVPLLFAVPPQLVPPMVVLGLALSRLPDVLRGDAPASRLWLSFANAWFTIGPALVLLLVDDAERVERSLPLVAALLGAQIAVDFVASAIREALVRGASLREQLTDAVWVYGVDAALTPAAMLAAAAVVADSWKALAMLPLVLLLASFARERSRRLESAFALTRAYRGMALVLGDVVEADDRYTGEHCKDVVTLALNAGRRLELDAERMRNLEFGALLHDVGKIAVPKAIINKPGSLTPEEFEVVKRHTIEGQRMLDRVGGFMRDVGLIVRHHHERWDGQGYPDGLAGAEIPLEARIVACCDTVNAMTTDRPYRRALPLHEAVEELRRCAATQFDPDVVRAVLDVLAEDPPFVASIGAAPSVAPRGQQAHARRPA
jgi:putative nucleotidyltransferase with HDIG domain